jgi:galactokinase
MSPGTLQDSIIRGLTESFWERYAASPRIVRAPGRVNLIGEHTDYNEGFVMPVAIDSYMWVAAAPRSDRRLCVYSEHFDEAIEMSLDNLDGPTRKHWSDYVRGVAATVMERVQAPAGANLLIQSDVPIGAGLSSSAALEVGVALALVGIWGIEISSLALIRACQKAEHDYAGTHCGIMDQFIATSGRRGHALLLDCRSLDCTLLPINGDFRIVICNSTVKHALAGGEYNRRREQCEAAVSSLQHGLPRIRALRDLSMDDLEHNKHVMTDTVYKRCRHVVTENQRVINAADALQHRDLVRFGRLMYESHASLRDDYEVSCNELDLLVAIASNCSGVYGARMTGGGFGGCTVNLVQAADVARVRNVVIAEYQKATGKRPDVYVCSPANGACEI